jgi:hypothetical protein
LVRRLDVRRDPTFAETLLPGARKNSTRARTPMARRLR